MMLCSREEMIVDFKPRLFFRPAIKATQIRKKVELQTRSGFEKSAGLNDVFARNDDGCLAQRLDNFANPFRTLTL